jgi:hypothetical protein
MPTNVLTCAVCLGCIITNSERQLVVSHIGWRKLVTSLLSKNRLAAIENEFKKMLLSGCSSHRAEPERGMAIARSTSQKENKCKKRLYILLANATQTSLDGRDEIAMKYFKSSGLH